MPRLSSSILAIPAAALSLLLAGCGNDSEEALGVAVVGYPAAPFESGARLSLPAQLVRGATAEGLVGFDEKGRVVPALASRWIVTDDGLSYIFRLRDGTWPDSRPLTGETAALALRQALQNVRATPLGADLGGIENVIARTGRVVEIQLARPNPQLLQLLAQPELGLLRNGKGTGPLRLRREKDVAMLIPVSPEKRGLPREPGWRERIRPIHLRALSAEGALAAFDSGEADIVLGGTMANYPLARRVGIARASVQLDPVSGLFGFVVVRGEGFLALPENREALAMAIDREALGAAFDAEGWVASTRLVAFGLEGDMGAVGERWQADSIAERQARAAQRVARWRNSSGGGAARLRIALPRGPGADLIEQRLVADCKAIGVECTRVAADADADLRLVDILARHAHASWFLGQLACTAGRGLCSATADTLSARAATEGDPRKQGELYADAEAELTKANVFLPLGQPLRWTLLRRGTSGFAPNAWGIHPLIALAGVPR